MIFCYFKTYNACQGYGNDDKSGDNNNNDDNKPFVLASEWNLCCIFLRYNSNHTDCLSIVVIDKI